MPIYAYECNNCGQRFELLRSINDRDAVAKCPACEQEVTERVCAPFSFSGFANLGGRFGSGGVSAPT